MATAGLIIEVVLLGVVVFMFWTMRQIKCNHSQSPPEYLCMGCADAVASGWIFNLAIIIGVMPTVAIITVANIIY